MVPTPPGANASWCQHSVASMSCRVSTLFWPTLVGANTSSCRHKLVPTPPGANTSSCQKSGASMSYRGRNTVHVNGRLQRMRRDGNKIRCTRSDVVGPRRPSMRAPPHAVRCTARLTHGPQGTGHGRVVTSALRSVELTSVPAQSHLPRSQFHTHALALARTRIHKLARTRTNARTHARACTH